MNPTVTSSKHRKQVGRRPVRHDGVEKVTGHALYGADIRLPGMLHAKVLRSPHAHARLLSVDTSGAEAHPDVRAVVAAADLPALDADAAADVQLGHMRDTAWRGTRCCSPATASRPWRRRLPTPRKRRSAS